jgi:hypothetical protein
MAIATGIIAQPTHPRHPEEDCAVAGLGAGPAIAGAGVGVAGVGAADIAEPHSEQKRAPARSGCPHAGQADGAAGTSGGAAAPHELQKRPCGASVAPHWAQCLSITFLLGSTEQPG